MSRDTRGGTDAACCKVGRVAAGYDLDDLDGELEVRWTGRGEESASLRELREYVNRRLLGAALTAAGERPIEGEVENLRRVLRDDDVTESRRVEAVRRLEREGVDVDGLRRDFVSHQTVHSHLRDCLDVSASTDLTPEERLERGASTIYALQNRTDAVTERTVGQLVRNESLALGEFETLVDIRVICADCGRSHAVGDLIDRGGCPCHLD